jgi:hypothetical protein
MSGSGIEHTPESFDATASPPTFIPAWLQCTRSDFATLVIRRHGDLKKQGFRQIGDQRAARFGRSDPAIQSPNDRN